MINPRLVFLARAAARLILVEAREMTLAEAFDGLMPFAERWEITHPPVPRVRPLRDIERRESGQGQGEIIPRRRQ